MTEIEKEAREYRGELKDPAITEAYIAGRTKSEGRIAVLRKEIEVLQEKNKELKERLREP